MNEAKREEAANALLEALITEADRAWIEIIPLPEQPDDAHTFRAELVVHPEHPRFEEIAGAIHGEEPITRYPERVFSERDTIVEGLLAELSQAREELTKREAELSAGARALDRSLMAHEMLRVDHSILVEERGAGVLVGELTRELAEAAVQQKDIIARVNAATAHLDSNAKALGLFFTFLGRLWGRLNPGQSMMDHFKGAIPIEVTIKEVEERISALMVQHVAAGKALDLIWTSTGRESSTWKNSGDVVEAVAAIKTAALAVPQGIRQAVSSFARGFERGVRFTPEELVALDDLWGKVGSQEPWVELQDVVSRALHAIEFACVLSDRQASNTINAVKRLAALERLAKLATGDFALTVATVEHAEALIGARLREIKG